MSQNTRQRWTQTTKKQLADRLYDLIMASIEPDLLIANLDVLEQKYTGESQEEHAERMQRYKQAYKKLDSELTSYLSDIQNRARTSRKSAFRKQERKSAVNDQIVLSRLEDQLA